VKKDWKYILYVSLAIGLFVAVKLMSPKQYNWTVTLAHDDKNPYGTYVLSNLLPTILAEQKIKHSYQTLYELKDSLTSGENIFIISSNFSCDKEDTDALLKHVNEGGNALISADYFLGYFADTINVGTYDAFFKNGNILDQNDTSHLKFTNHKLDTTTQYWYKRNSIHNYFEKFDTLRTTIIAKNDYQQPVTLKITWGKGNLILNCTPLAFTNIYALSKANHNFISTTFSYLPERKLQWTEFYHLGRMESNTPLRFILNNEALQWAYYITIIAILLFMFFEAKRKQRIIPIVTPLGNTSLEFISTIGNLYYQNGDHKNIAEKKIAFLLEQIRTKYLLKTNVFNDEFISSLARKSGNNLEDVKNLFQAISFIMSSTIISKEQLIDLNNRIEQFNSHEHN
jgi:hypothetical protein